MRLREITVAPAFALNQRQPLLSGRLPLSDGRVISSAPHACATSISPGGLTVFDLPSSPMLRAAPAGGLETSAIAQRTQISDRIYRDISAHSHRGSCSDGSLRQSFWLGRCGPSKRHVLHRAKSFGPLMAAAELQANAGKIRVRPLGGTQLLFAYSSVERY
jgi:hypothetical protein